MTEAEARGKWCPFARVINGEIRPSGASSHNSVQVSYNRIVDEERYAFPKAGGCIASECMAWRSTSDFAKEGYCGLAGRPVV